MARRAVITFTFMLLSAACAGSPPGDGTPPVGVLYPDPELGFDRKVVVVSTDYQSGSYAVLDLDLMEAAPDLGPAHPDAVARVAGDQPVVVNRQGADSLQPLDPEAAFAVAAQLSVGNGANPQDVAIVGGAAWVPRYAMAQLGIFDLEGGAALGEVDLSPFADGDGLPEAVAVTVVGDYLYVLLQRLDQGGTWLPTGVGLLAIVDPTAWELVDADPDVEGVNAIPLGFGNPVDRPLLLPDGRLAVLTQGSYTEVGDGAIEVIDLNPPYARQVVVTEDQVGGSVTFFATLAGERWFVVVNEAREPGTFDVATVLKSVDAQGEVVELLRTEGYDLADIAVTGAGELLVADRRAGAAGVRVFDARTLEEITAAPISVGLAPFSLAAFDDPAEGAEGR